MKYNRIRKARVSAKMTAAELAAKAGLSEKTIYDYERLENPNPHVNNLVRIADALNTTLDYLCGRTAQDDDYVLKLLKQIKRLEGEVKNERESSAELRKTLFEVRRLLMGLERVEL